jgi:hypothetical protein
MINEFDHDFDQRQAEAEESTRNLVRPAIAGPMRGEFRADLARQLRAIAPRPATPGAPLRPSWSWLGFSPARVGLGLALVASLIVTGSIAYPRLTANADASAVVSQVQNATEAVPAGQVRHVVTTYTGYPKPTRTGTLEQWFGTVDGRDVTRQVGPAGDVTVVDASDTLWIALPGGEHVIKMLHVSGRFPMPTPNRVALYGVGAKLALNGAQSRVTGHTSVNGRPATEIEFVQPMPTHVDGPTAVAAPGMAAGGGPTAVPAPDKSADEPTGRKHPVTLIVDDGGPAVPFSGALAGGSVVTDMVVDDESHQILRGTEVTRDNAGTTLDTMGWKVTTDELVSAAQVPPMTERPNAGSAVLAWALILAGLGLLAANLGAALLPWLAPILLMVLGVLSLRVPEEWALWRASRAARRAGWRGR